MSEPPLSGDVWRRGAALGLIWLAVLAGTTIIVFLLMGLSGWSGVGRALCAMGIGPVVGLSLIAVWWMMRRPMLGTQRGDIESVTHGGGEGQDDESMER